MNERIIDRRAFIRTAAMISAGAATTILAGCSGTPDTNAASSTARNGDASDSGQGKTLVAYFSAQGHTKAVAEKLADELGADLFQIVPQQPYSNDDLDWTEDTSRVNREHDDESQRDIQLEQTAPDAFGDYDRVLVGYPIWWGDAAWPVNRFITGNDFTGKTVIPFCTSASSGLGQSGDALAELAGTGDWKDGERFSSGASNDDVRSWAQSL